MKFLFIHQNFPGQFLHVVQALADNPAHEVWAMGEARNMQGRPSLHSRLRTVAYQAELPDNSATHHYLRDHEQHVRRGQIVARALLQLQQGGFYPDVIVAHPGWGEGLFVKDIYPRSRYLAYLEFFYHGQGADVGFDPEFPCQLDDLARVRVKNNTQLLTLVACDEGLAPTQWQKSRYPQAFHDKIRCVHDGIDCQRLRPDAEASFTWQGQDFQAGQPIVTFVARNLEPYRGFHSFVRALPRLQALYPEAQVLMVGGDGVSYGRRLPPGESYKARYCQALQGQVDWSRVHFLGRIPYSDYVRVLQVSAAHVYLTYPFVLSWSMLEAMAAGCLLVASATPPVQELIQHGQNGLLVDFFQPEALAETVAHVLRTPEAYQGLRQQARATIQNHYDLQQHCLPQWLAWLQQGMA